MGLIDRLQDHGQRAPSPTGPSLFGTDTRQQTAPSIDDVGKELFQALKGRIQDLLLKKIDVTRLEDAGYGPLFRRSTRPSTNWSKRTICCSPTPIANAL